mmetsp:Transcript_53473/g.124554  ORF Transcript_53473/g.124554 Transcript_53473/m.124554 type:complete len:460 (+) Transcript_53473:30-1409(+)
MAPAKKAKAQGKGKGRGGRGKGCGKGGRGRGCDEEGFTDFQVDDWRCLPASADSSANEKIKGVKGHCIVSHGARLWCIGGSWGREKEPDEAEASVPISLWCLDLHTRCWTDKTPRTTQHAPSYRWGQSSVLLPSNFPLRPGKKVNHVLLMCGGFDTETNMNDVWFFCPASGKFCRPKKRLLWELPISGAYHALAYDQITDEAYLFGGQCCIHGFYAYFDTLLSCGLSGPIWHIVHPRSSRPPPRGQHAAAISKRVLVIHGGSNRYRTLRDVWTMRLDAAHPIWSEVKIQGPPLWVGQRQKAQPYQTASCRPFMALADTSDRGLLVLGRSKPNNQQPCGLSLWALNLRRPCWRQVPVATLPAWSGNFAASFHEGGTGDVLLVFGGEHGPGGPGGLEGPGKPLWEGGLWTIDLAAKPSKLLLLTLQKAFSQKPRNRRFSEDVLKTIFSYAMGRLMDMVPSL